MKEKIFIKAKSTESKKKIIIHFPRFHLLSIAAIIFVLAAWTLISELRILKPIFLPSPTDLYNQFKQVKGDLAYNYLLTFYRMIIGFVLGSSAGILVSLIMARSRIASAITNPIINLLKPIPPLVLAPFAILWWGISIKGVFFLVIWGCFFVMVIDGIEAIKNVPKIYHWAGGALGATKGDILRKIVLPCMLPSIVGGLRISLVSAFNLTVLAEFNIASGGLGGIVIKGYRFLRTDMLFLGIFFVITLALVVDFIIVIISRKVFKWKY